MKAEINGIKLEGTPEEIHKFMELKEKKMDYDFFKKLGNIPPYKLQVTDKSTIEVNSYINNL